MDEPSVKIEDGSDDDDDDVEKLYAAEWETVCVQVYRTCELHLERFPVPGGYLYREVEVMEDDDDEAELYTYIASSESIFVQDAC